MERTSLKQANSLHGSCLIMQAVHGTLTPTSPGRIKCTKFTARQSALHRPAQMYIHVHSVLGKLSKCLQYVIENSVPTILVSNLPQLIILCKIKLWIKDKA